VNLPRPAAAVVRLLATLRLGAPRARGALAVWPLLGGEESSGTIAPLAEACGRGEAHVEALGDGALPARVHVTNRAGVPVLALFGEELAGDGAVAVPNASFLVAPRSRLAIDVSLLDAPGGASGPRDLLATGRFISSELRRRMAVAVAEARASGGRFDADQEEVRAHGAAAARSVAGGELEAVQIHRGQVGFVAVVGEAIAGVEVLCDARLFAAVGPRLLAAYGAEAREHHPYFPSPQAFLSAIGEAPCEANASLGLGRDLRFRGGGVAGFALESAGRVLHLLAFPH
jgi:hypothetical protein